MTKAASWCLEGCRVACLASFADPKDCTWEIRQRSFGIEVAGTDQRSRFRYDGGHWKRYVICAEVGGRGD